MNCQSNTEEDCFWGSLSSLEDESKTLTEVNTDKSETVIDAKADNTESEFEAELFEKVWDNIHMKMALDNELDLRGLKGDTVSRNKDTVDTEETKKEEAGLETSETEAKKTSLGGNSPSKLKSDKTKKRQHRKIGQGKDIIFCNCWKSHPWKGNWRSDGKE